MKQFHTMNLHYCLFHYCFICPIIASVVSFSSSKQAPPLCLVQIVSFCCLHLMRQSWNIPCTKLEEVFFFVFFLCVCVSVYPQSTYNYYQCLIDFILSKSNCNLPVITFYVVFYLLCFAWNFQERLWAFTQKRFGFHTLFLCLLKKNSF